MEENRKIKFINKELQIENDVLMSNLQKKIDENEELKSENENLKKENENLKNENQNLRSELDKIVYSRSYKMIQKAKKIIKRG